MGQGGFPLDRAQPLSQLWIMSKVHKRSKGEQNLTGLEAIQRNADNIQKTNAEMAGERSVYRKKVSGYPDTLTDSLVKDSAKDKTPAKDTTMFLVGLGRSSRATSRPLHQRGQCLLWASTGKK